MDKSASSSEMVKTRSALKNWIPFPMQRFNMCILLFPRLATGRIIAQKGVVFKMAAWFKMRESEQTLLVVFDIFTIISRSYFTFLYKKCLQFKIANSTLNLYRMDGNRWKFSVERMDFHFE